MEARDLPDSGYHHPLQAFYSRELLALQSSEGLYSRPAASALVVPNIPQLIRDADIGHDNNVLLVASTIGGTGAGMSLQLLCRVQELSNRLREVKLRAVLSANTSSPMSANWPAPPSASARTKPCSSNRWNTPCRPF